MEVLITPEYHNLFPGENDSLEDLLQDIPSIIVIQLIAMIDATLHVYQEDLVTQGKLFNLMLNRQLQKPELF
jgi:hypothetical protein